METHNEYEAPKLMAPRWERQGNVLAYPHGWQQPAKTEAWAYERCCATTPRNPFIQFVCFPWATLIDLIRREQNQRAQAYMKALQATPPKSTLIRATVCQHIWAKEMLPWFRQLQITDLFWSHAVVGETEIEGIRIHPFPLFPVCCADHQRHDEGSNSHRTYLYSFVGAYQPELYLTQARHWIFQLPKRSDSFVLERKEWHFEKQVYDQQIGGRMLEEVEVNTLKAERDEYRSVMQNSLFSLCPSGSGPNSIRLWEALGLGSIPVLISDTLHLPGLASDWADAVVTIKEEESAIQQIPDQLAVLSQDTGKIESLKNACAKLWNQYGIDGAPISLDSLLPRLAQNYKQAMTI